MRSEAGAAALGAAAVGPLVVATGGGHEPRQPPGDAEEPDRKHREPIFCHALLLFGGRGPDRRPASIIAAAAEVTPTSEITAAHVAAASEIAATPEVTTATKIAAPTEI